MERGARKNQGATELVPKGGFGGPDGGFGLVTISVWKTRQLVVLSVEVWDLPVSAGIRSDVPESASDGHNYGHSKLGFRRMTSVSASPTYKYSKVICLRIGDYQDKERQN